MSQQPINTARLRLRQLGPDDAAFMLELLNDPDFIRYVGDRKVRTAEDARESIERGPLESYKRHGHGLMAVELRRGGTPIGMCGLLRREGLADPDLGFAFLPAYRGAGYAHEAALAVLEHGRWALRIRRIVAITDPENAPSIKLLARLGMRPAGAVVLPGIAGPSMLFVSDILLRVEDKGDADILFEQQRDAVALRMAAFTPKDAGDRGAFDARRARGAADLGVVERIVTLGGRVVGSVLSYVRDGEREVSYWIGREYWGRGIASAALTAYLEIMLERPLWARVACDNAASGAVLRKCGFRIVGKDKGFAEGRGEETAEYILRLGAGRAPVPA